MAQTFDAPSKAILRSQIAEHIAETDKPDKREPQAGEEPLPADRYFDRELSWLKFNQRVLELAEDEAPAAAGTLQFRRDLRLQPR